MTGARVSLTLSPHPASTRGEGNGVRQYVGIFIEDMMMVDENDREPVPEKPAPASTSRNFLGGVPATYFLIGINLAVLGFAYYRGAAVFEPTSALLVKWGANYGPRTFNGEYWRLVTSLFIQFGPVWFVALNLYVLWTIGKDVERIVGSFRFLCIYLFAGVGGNLGKLVWNPAGYSVGGVGGIMGIIGALGAYFVCNRRWIPAQAMKAQLMNLMYCILLNLALNATISGNVSGILGGLLIGTLAGFAFVKVLPGENYWKVRQTLGVILLALALSLGFRAAEAGYASPVAALSPKDEVRDEITVDKAQIQYSSDYTLETVQRFGKEFEKAGYSQYPWTVLLRKTNGKIAIGLIVKEGVWDKKDMVEELEGVCRRMAIKVFEGKNVELQLFNKSLELKKTIEVKPKMEPGMVI